jgi:ABC-2 type transport system permease protein
MSTMTYALRDSATMLRRNLRHIARYPSVTLSVLGVPIIFMLLFVYVFGGTLGAGLPGGGLSSGGLPGGGRTEYLNYLVPGILLLTISGAVQGTAISVAMDMTEGIIARFRTMAIARVSVLTGHVVGSLIQTVLGMTIVVALALLLGFRPDARPVEWVAVAGLLALTAFALIWLSVAFGLVSKTVEGASNLPMPLIILPFLGSGFVPTESMPAGLRWFAEYQPFTPIIETVRGLLMGTAIGASGVLAVAWSAGIAAAAYLWARKLYNRDPIR